MWASHTRRQFTAADPMVYFTNAIGFMQWNREDSGGVWLADPEISLLPRVGRVEITADPGRKNNVIKNSTFDDFTQSGGVMLYWGGSGTHDEQDGYIDLGYVVGTKSDYIAIDNYLDGVKKVRFVMEFKVTWAVATTACEMNFEFGYMGWYFNAAGWQSSQADYAYDIYTELHPDNGMADYGTFAIDFPSPGDDDWDWGDATDFTIKIYELELDAGTAVFEIRDVRLEVEYFDKSPETLQYSIDNDVASFKTVRENLRQIDASGVVAGTHFYDGDTLPYLQISATRQDQTDEWFIVGHPTTVTTPQVIQQLLARQLVEGSWLPTTMLRGTLRTIGNEYSYHKALVENDIVDSYGFAKVFLPLDIEWDIHRKTWDGTWVEVSPIYTAVSLDWATETYATAGLDGNEVDMNETVSGTMTATSETFGVILGEMIRVVVTVVDGGSTDVPNYYINGETGTLAIGTNYLSLRMSVANAVTYFQINHTDGETANCVVTFLVYRLTGI